MKLIILMGFIAISLVLFVSNGYAETTQLTPLTGIIYDYNYTKDYPMLFSKDKFIIEKIIIIPMISITNMLSESTKEYNISASKVDFTYKIDDYGYKRKWSLNFIKPIAFVGDIKYIAFDIKGCNKSSDFVLQCGNIEIDFSDLYEMGFDVSMTDTKVVVSNSLLFLSNKISLDPTDQLLPNATNKAYVVSSTGTDSPNQAITEFSSAEYTAISTSNNAYVSSNAIDDITYSGCTMSNNYYYCKNSGETCASATCRKLSTCLIDNCHIGSCTALTQATNLSQSCTLSPLGGYSCGCLENGCSGRYGQCDLYPNGTCTVSGSCTYTCNTGKYNCDGNDANGCEATSICSNFTFQRFTFNLSSYDMTASNITFCWEGKYNSTGGSNSSNLLYYNNNTATWTSWKTLTYNSEATSCIYFDITNNTVYNSTSKLVQFAIRGNQSRTGHTLTLYSDYAYLNITYPSEIPPPISIKCEYLCNSEDLEASHFNRNNDLLLNQKDKLIIMNLDNENMTNLDTNCLLFGNYKNNLCININSKNAIYIKDLDEKNNDNWVDQFLDLLYSIFSFS